MVEEFTFTMCFEKKKERKNYSHSISEAEFKGGDLICCCSHQVFNSVTPHYKTFPHHRNVASRQVQSCFPMGTFVSVSFSLLLYQNWVTWWDETHFCLSVNVLCLSAKYNLCDGWFSLNVMHMCIFPEARFHGVKTNKKIHIYRPLKMHKSLKCAQVIGKPTKYSY